jgi:outer membrane protein OmpA-like peptidoglycan-associated protein
MNARTLSSSAMTALSLLLGTALALSVSNAQAQELDPKEVRRVENTGVLTGGAVGALIGGPPGAIVGAALGGVLSDKVLVGRHNRLLKAQVEADRAELLALQEANADLQAQLIASHNESGANLLATTSNQVPGVACCGDSALVLHFRSGSSDVEKLYDEQLEEFVSHVQSVPGAVVEIYGYADRRGEQNDNLWLSQERVQSVEKSLRSLGLKNFTYETTALGEGAPATPTDTLENNFFDRRVVLRLRKDRNEYLSSTR